MIELYDYFRSSASYRVRITLNYKKLEYTKNEVHLVNNGGEQHSDHYKKMNPQQLVPSLLDNNNVLTQSLAIIEYLEEQHPEPPILPEDPYKRSQARSLAYIIACDVHPLNNLRVLNYLKDTYQVSDEQKMQWYHHWLDLGFSSIENHLASLHCSSGPLKFCLDNKLSLADICLIPQVYNALRFKFDISKFPNILSVYNHCLQLDYIKDAAPE